MAAPFDSNFRDRYSFAKVPLDFILNKGEADRSRSVFGTIGAGIQTLVGGNITLFSELCEQTRADAFEMMVSHAQDIGANAVIGVRYDATEIMQGVTEVLCYGTAVVVKPIV